MKKNKIIPIVLLAAVVFFAGIAWVIAKAPVTDPENEPISPAEITIERILAANHPATLLRSGGNFLLEVDGEEKYQYFVDDGVVLKEDAESDKTSLIVDREYVVNRQGENYDTVAVSDSDFQGSWYADLILNTSLLLKESITSTAEENGDFVVTTSLSGEDYDDHYNRAVRSTASCTTVYTLDSTTCRVKSVTQTAHQEDGTAIVNTLTLTENVGTPAAVSTMSAKASYTATESTDNFKLDKNGDGEINILFIGNSYSCYWTDELYFLLKEAGYEKDENGKSVTLNVCNLYRSGADFVNHWEEYERGVSNFTLYTVFNGSYNANSLFNPKLPHDPDTREKITCGLLHTLTYGHNEAASGTTVQWDIISFQQGNDYSQREAEHRNSIEKHFPMLYELVTSYHPNARYYWQQDWPHEYFESRVDSLDAVQNFRKVGLEVCREYDLINAPLGDAWQIVEHDPTFFKYDKTVSANPIYSLHSRLRHTTEGYGQVDESDDSHDGDVGGGQYLNACVWFEILTRTRVQDTAAADYIPAYRTGDILQRAQGAYYIGMSAHYGEHRRVATLETVKDIVTAAQAKLQHAAHTAVLASYGEDFFID